VGHTQRENLEAYLRTLVSNNAEASHPKLWTYQKRLKKEQSCNLTLLPFQKALSNKQQTMQSLPALSSKSKNYSVLPSKLSNSKTLFPNPLLLPLQTLLTKQHNSQSFTTISSKP
jgi:hypothetical protein